MEAVARVVVVTVVMIANVHTMQFLWSVAVVVVVIVLLTAFKKRLCLQASWLRAADQEDKSCTR